MKIRSLLLLIVLAASACTRTTPSIESPSSSSTQGLDEVTLQDGQKLNGRVLFENEAWVVLGQPNGTFNVKRADIREVRRGAAARGMNRGRAHSERLPPFSAMLEVVATQPWVKDLRQVPATVIDMGDLRYIPYISHRSGRIEFNVYGDPDHPAGVEIGIYDPNPDVTSKEQLRSFLLEVLSNEEDRSVLRGIGLEDDTKERDGLTFEVDPATATDSYGGWWITVYDSKALDSARASADQLGELTAPLGLANDPTAYTSSWGAADYSYSSPRSSGGSKAVYVRGYTRRDGTYVRPHTRSSPSRRR